MVDLHRPMEGIFHLQADGCLGALLYQHICLAQLRETKGGEHSNWSAAYDQVSDARGRMEATVYRVEPTDSELPFRPS